MLVQTKGMRMRLLLVVSAGLLLACCSRESWRPVEPAYTPETAPGRWVWRNLNPTLRSIYRPGEGKSLWAVGDDGRILHTADGETWKPQTSGTPKDLTSIYGTGDGKSLWAVGYEGTILHTTGGEWKPQTS